MRTTSRLDQSFNPCPVHDGLPSELQLEPFARPQYYRAWIRPYAAYAHSVRALHLNDTRLRLAEHALGAMHRYLRRFRNARRTECGLLRGWQASGFDHPFDIASYAGVSSTAPPTRKLQATRAALSSVVGRLRQLGVPPERARLFLVASDPFR
jgi:hypothetical protein